MVLAKETARGDQFGFSVAISGNIVIIGSYRADGPVRDSGLAYLFDANTGKLLFKLIPDDNKGGFCGFSVGISGNTAIVGAILNDENGPESGAAYFFDTVTGEQIAKNPPRRRRDS